MVQALVWNVGTCRPDAKGEVQVDAPRDERTDAGHRGGVARSSDEGAVMVLERRRNTVQLYRKVNRAAGGAFG